MSPLNFPPLLLWAQLLLVPLLHLPQFPHGSSPEVAVPSHIAHALPVSMTPLAVAHNVFPLSALRAFHGDRTVAAATVAAPAPPLKDRMVAVQLEKEEKKGDGEKEKEADEVPDGHPAELEEDNMSGSGREDTNSFGTLRLCPPGKQNGR